MNGWTFARALAIKGLPCRAIAAAAIGLASGGAQGEPLRPEVTRAEQLATDRVHAALEARDCSKAVQYLNEGLSARHPGLYLIAGTMFEEGLCLKPDWNRAQRHYQAGLEAGHRGGLFKMVAGLAQGPRDVAAALWWAQRGLTGAMPAPCLAEPAIHEVPEKYVEWLQSWPASRLSACVYTAGVLATLTGDLLYPQQARSLQLTGRVAMRFVPAEGRIDWTTLESDMPPPVGVVSEGWMRDRRSPRVQDFLRRHLDAAGQQALKRFEPRPPGIDPGWTSQQEYVFTLQ